MATFNYVALDSKGSERTGVIDADTESAAVSRIREQGLFPTNVAPAGAAAKGKKEKKGPAGPRGAKAAGSKGLKMDLQMPSFLQRVKTKELTVFTRQMATLINAGLPLLRGLQVLQKQEKNPMLKRIVGELADSIQSGTTFAEALGQHPKVFNKLYVNMVKAGEIGGVLDVVLNRLSEFMEKAQKIKSKVVSAMVYPVVVLIMAGAILGFLMTFIIPKFEEIFKDLLEGKAMPALTRGVLAASRAFTSKMPFIIVGVVVLVFLIKLFGRTRQGRYAMDNLKLHIPVFGQLLRKTAIARFSRTLGTLMSSGVPVLQALNIVRDTSGNEVVARAVHSVHDSVKEGENMAPPLEASGVFPPVVISMVEVGEETGELPEMLMKIADNYDEEVDNAVAALTSVIEPILIIFLALIVGTIVISLFLPLISVIGEMAA